MAKAYQQVTLLSGGLSSTVDFWEACSRADDAPVAALTLIYGQEATEEVHAASRIVSEARRSFKNKFILHLLTVCGL